jgi:hypothetical protein
MNVKSGPIFDPIAGTIIGIHGRHGKRENEVWQPRFGRAGGTWRPQITVLWNE